MAKKSGESAPIRTQIYLVNLLVAAVALALAAGLSLFLTIFQEEKTQDRSLMNSAQLVAQMPPVIRDLQAGYASQELKTFLDNSISQISDVDVIVIADLNDTQLYAPNPGLIGRPYGGTAQEKIRQGKAAFNSLDDGGTGAARCAYAPVHGPEGSLLGFVMVGIYMRSLSSALWQIVFYFAVIAAAAAVLGGLISSRLSDRIKGFLGGYEPAAFLGLFHQREDILETLEEGILAIDAEARIMYLNRAAEEMLYLDRSTAEGRPLRQVLADSSLDRVLRTRQPEYNVSFTSPKRGPILSNQIPIREDGLTVGAVAIFRNRTEVTRLADDLTGFRHMVEAMRAYTHEFMNKLHVILGLLQLGETREAEAYIMGVTSIHQRAIGTIADSIKSPSVAALLVGKTSRCAELGIKLSLAAGSRLSEDQAILPPAACVTIMGNLIENAAEALNQAGHSRKEIMVSIREETDSLLLCVEDTGPGIQPEISRKIFRQGYTTKGQGRGTGLALVQETTEAYQGQIRVESEPGVGTTFFLTFHREPKEENTNV